MDDPCTPARPAGAARRQRARVAALLVVVCLAACGPDDDPDSHADGPGAASTPEVGGPAAAARAERPAPDAARDAQIDRLLDAWLEAEAGRGVPDGRYLSHLDAIAALEKEILAEGAPAMERLLAWLADTGKARRDTAAELIPLFGDAAVPAIVAIARDGSGESVIAAMHTTIGLLCGRVSSERLVEDLCRALADRGMRGSDDEMALAFGALRDTRAASCVAADLGRHFAATWRDERQRDATLRVLESLGPGASAAAPVLAAWLRERTLAPGPDADGEAGDADDGYEELALRVREVLAEAGPGTPSVVEDLRAILRSGTAGAPAAAAYVIARWGEAGAAAVPDLVALLAHPDGDVRDGAARALAAIPSSVPAARESLVALLAHESDEMRLDAGPRSLRAFLRDPEFVAGLLAAMTASKDEFVVQNLFNAAAPAFALGRDPAPFVRALTARPEAELRRHAVEIWGRTIESGAPPPPEFTALLDDPDEGVRFAVAEQLAECGGTAPDRLAAAAAAGLSLDGWDHFAALDLLARVAPGDPRVRATLLADLDVEERCAEALARLADDPREIAGRHAVALETVCDRIAHGALGVNSLARAVLRLDGGPEALAATLGRLLEDERESRFRLAEIASMADALGARAAPHRAAIVALRSRFATDEHSDGDVRQIDLVLAGIDGDPQAMALASLDYDDLAKLVAMGDPGRRAAVLLAGRLAAERWFALDEDAIRVLAAAHLDDEIIAASSASIATDSWARERRLGALMLVVLLPSARAQAMLRAVESDPAKRDVPSLVDAWVRVAARDGGTLADAEAAAAALRRLLTATGRSEGDSAADVWRRLLDARPEVVRAADVAPLLAPGVAWADAVALAGSLGSRGRDLLPALRELSERSAVLRLPAACAIHRIDGDARAALAAVRAWMAEPGARALWRACDPAATSRFLAALEFEPSDAPALATMVRLCDREPVGWIRAIGRLGPSAACAVPALRDALHGSVPGYESTEGRDVSWVDTVGESAARALVAIGPAARAALPDLRWRMANVGDNRDVLSEAVRRIAAGP